MAWVHVYLCALCVLVRRQIFTTLIHTYHMPHACIYEYDIRIYIYTFIPTHTLFDTSYF